MLYNAIVAGLENGPHYWYYYGLAWPPRKICCVTKLHVHGGKNKIWCMHQGIEGGGAWV